MLFTTNKERWNIFHWRIKSCWEWVREKKAKEAINIEKLNTIWQTQFGLLKYKRQFKKCFFLLWSWDIWSHDRGRVRISGARWAKWGKVLKISLRCSCSSSKPDRMSYSVPRNPFIFSLSKTAGLYRLSDKHKALHAGAFSQETKCFHFPHEEQMMGPIDRDRDVLCRWNGSDCHCVCEKPIKAFINWGNKLVSPRALLQGCKTFC